MRHVIVHFVGDIIYSVFTGLLVDLVDSQYIGMDVLTTQPVWDSVDLDMILIQD